MPSITTSINGKRLRGIIAQIEDLWRDLEDPSEAELQELEIAKTVLLMVLTRIDDRN